VTRTREPIQLILAVTSVAAAPQGIDQTLELGFGYFLDCCQFPKLGLSCLHKFFVLDDHPHASLDKLPDGSHLAFRFGFGLSLVDLVPFHSGFEPFGSGFSLGLESGLLLQDEFNSFLYVHTIQI
jgi:hypothetical protein